MNLWRYIPITHVILWINRYDITSDLVSSNLRSLINFCLIYTANVGFEHMCLTKGIENVSNIMSGFIIMLRTKLLSPCPRLNFFVLTVKTHSHCHPLLISSETSKLFCNKSCLERHCESRKGENMIFQDNLSVPDSDSSLHLLEHIERMLVRKFQTIPEVLHSQDKNVQSREVSLFSRHTSFYNVLLIDRKEVEVTPCSHQTTFSLKSGRRTTCEKLIHRPMGYRWLDRV